MPIHQGTSETIQHPSLTRVKGQIAMNTPPRRSSEISWLRDQSPASSSTPCTPRMDPCTDGHLLKPFRLHPLTRTTARSTDMAATTLVNPTSALLHDLIKEERASRGSRGRLSDVHDDDTPRTPASSHSNEDTPSDKQRKIKHAFSAGLKQPHEMGIREMDQYISKINKLNFDLKLEIFHRQQQMAALEAKLERTQELEEEVNRMHGLEEELEELRNVEGDNRRLRQSNEQLRTELDKRDQAITEAVALICKLEAKLDDLGGGGESSSRPTTALAIAPSDHLNVDVTTPKAQIAGDIPERTSSRRGTSIRHQRPPTESSSSRQLQRAPSFLREVSKNTATLRSLYVPGGHRSQSSLSVVTKLTESVRSGGTDAAEPDSPRLSILSECSDLAPYDTPSRAEAFDRLDIPIRNGSMPDDSSDSFVTNADGKTVTNAHPRIDQWLHPSSGLFDPEKSRRLDQTSFENLRNNTHSQSDDSDSFVMFKHKPQSNRAPRLDVTTVYGSARLPPTPDTMSTAHAVAIDRSDGSIATETSPTARHAAHVTDKRLSRPRSAGELTSRRNSTDSIETSLSDTTHFERSNFAGEEILAIFPFSGGSIKANQLLGPGKPSNPRLRDGGRDLWFNGDAIHDVRALRDERRFLSTTETETETPPKRVSASPPLTPQDWIDAARGIPTDRIQDPYESMNVNSHDALLMTTPDREVFPAQTPRQKHPLGRRHSVSSNHNNGDELNVPRTRGSLLPTNSNSSTEPKRRLSLRPRFFSRSATGTGSHRLQPSPIPTDLSASYPDRDPDPDLDSFDDCAPSPVIRKTRRASVSDSRGGGGATTPTQPNKLDAQRHEESCINTSSTLSSYDVQRKPHQGDYGDVSLRHQRSHQHAPPSQQHSSSTIESAASNNNSLSAPSSAVRPTTAGSIEPSEQQQQQQRRRSSLGIFAWMKGGSSANGSGTTKRSEPPPPMTPTPTSVATFTLTGPTHSPGNASASSRDRGSGVLPNEEERFTTSLSPSARIMTEKKSSTSMMLRPGDGPSRPHREHQYQYQHQLVRVRDHSRTNATSTAIPDSLAHIVSPPRSRAGVGTGPGQGMSGSMSGEEMGRRPPPRYVERRARRGQQLMQ